MTIELDTLLDLAYQQARRVLIGREGEELVPMWALVNEDDDMLIIGTPFRGSQDKDLCAMYMRKLMAEKGIVAYSFLCEAWVAVYPKDANLDNIPAPSKTPGRQEMVFAIASNREHTRSRSWHMRRDRRGRVTALPEEKSYQQSDQAFGKFDGLLQKSH